MMQTAEKKYAQTIFSAFAVILIGILAQAAPNLGSKLLLLVCGAGGVILYFCKDLIPNAPARKVLLWSAGTLFVVTLIWSVISAGSPAAYGKRVVAFFVPEAPEITTDMLYQDMGEENLQMERTLDGLDSQLVQMLGELELVSAAVEERQFLSRNDDMTEVEKISAIIQEKIKEDAERDNPSITSIKTDVHAVELLYKIHLAPELCHYSSFIKALEAAGVDCKSMSVDEYTLMQWDVEYFFSLYNMRRSLLDDVAQDVAYEENKVFRYRDFKVSEQNEYSDVCDYGAWQVWYSPRAAEKIANSLDKDFIKFYQKLNMNFRR